MMHHQLDFLEEVDSSPMETMRRDSIATAYPDAVAVLPSHVVDIAAVESETESSWVLRKTSNPSAVRNNGWADGYSDCGAESATSQQRMQKVSRPSFFQVVVVEGFVSVVDGRDAGRNLAAGPPTDHEPLRTSIE